MATNVTLNGSTYSIPAEGDSGWSDLSTYFIAIASSVLQKTGGTFTLTAEANFGATYGLKSAYIKSQGTNPASAGVIRLANAETISWRNAANSADLAITVNSSNVLQFNGASPVFSGSIVNADIDAAAAIAYSKLNLSTSIVNADISASAAIAYSKLNLATSIVNADISGSAAIAYSKLNLGTSIVNADISASAAIALSKLATVTASRALVSDGSGNVSASSVTSTTLGYLDATSSIQTQLDGKVAKSTLTTKGDIYVATGASTVVRQAIGADNTFLKADSSQTNGLIWASVAGAALSVTSKTTTYTATTGDDVILVDTSGGAWTLTLYAASGNSGKVLTIKKTTSDFTALTIATNASETIDGQTTTTVNTQFEALKIICDGTNWHILERKINESWIAYTPTYSGLGTLSLNTAFWRRVGDELEVKALATAGTTAASLAYLTLPSGKTIDSTKIGTNALIGKLSASQTPFSGGLVAFPGTSTTNIYFSSDLANYNTGVNGDTWSNSTSFGIFFSVPITGWKGN